MLLFQIVQKECEKDKYTKQMEGIFISLRNLNVIYGSWMVVEFDGFFFVQLPKGYSGHAYSTSALILLEYILYGAVNTML